MSQPRRAHALTHLARSHPLLFTAQADYSAAKADLREASKLDPKNKEVREMFAACQAKENEAKKAEKALAAKMFG